MFLPVLLLRDFGPASFWVFAIPNVVGAALMGVLLAKPGASESLIARHAWACWAFSLVTAAFQWFFLVWMTLGLPDGPARYAVAIPAGLTILAAHFGRHRSGWTLAVATLVALTSFVLAALWLSGTWGTGPSDTVVIPALPEKDLAWLAPVIVFGFALCPYLDLTFHRARKQLPGRAGSLAFIIGFGVLFFAMILLTRAYAPGLLIDSATAGIHVQPALLALPLLAHVSMQLVYTISLHNQQLADHTAPAATAIPLRPHLGPILAILFGVGAGFLARFLPDYGTMSASELTYRSFMAFYGLAFPAYVWLCVLGRGPLTRRTFQVYAAAVAIAAPMYWMGFIERQTSWLAPGLGVVLVARLFDRRGTTVL